MKEERFEPNGMDIRVRVSGPQVTANKEDKGDRPCMYVFVDGEEFVVHEVEFHGPTVLQQNFAGGCPITGAILWLQTSDPVTVRWRDDMRLAPHMVARRRLEVLDDVMRQAT